MINASEHPDAKKELPPELREFLVAKLAEMLVLDYRQTHGISVPTDGQPTEKRGEP